MFVVVLILILLLLFWYSRTEYFADRTQQIMDAVADVNKSGGGFAAFKEKIGVNTFVPLAFAKLLQEHRAGTLTREKVQKITGGEYE